MLTENDDFQISDFILERRGLHKHRMQQVQST
jgi:hypothetical protein